MSSTDINNAVWRKLVLGEINYNPQFLAAGLMLWRLKTKIKNNNSEETISASQKEIFDLYYKSKDLPHCKADLAFLLK